MTTKDKLREKYIKVQVDYAPKKNGKAFEKWCKKYGFDYLASGRRAWCSSLQTYFRAADGVAFNDGEMFLFYEDDSIDIQLLISSKVLQVLDSLEESIRQHTVPEGRGLLSKDYVQNTIAFERKKYEVD